MRAGWAPTATGFDVLADGVPVAYGGPSLVSLRLPNRDSGLELVWDRSGSLVGSAAGIRVAVTVNSDGDALCLSTTIRNEGAVPLRLNAMWRIRLLGEPLPAGWLVPGLLYGDLAQQYEATPPALAADLDLPANRSPYWIFRSDLTAVPLVLGRTEDAAVALAVDEQAEGHRTSIGLDTRDATLIAAWPCREEPRPRDSATPRDGLRPQVTLAELASGEEATIRLSLMVGEPGPHAFAPMLRALFLRNSEHHAPRPWYPWQRAAELAAHGLMKWHFDPEAGALWETCAFDPVAGHGPRQVDRFEMHTAFVSGVPYGHALRRRGIRLGDEAMAAAGRRIIDLCTSRLTPFGTFYARFSREEGWIGSWPSPQRANRQANLGSSSGELQARTLAEATIFAARAALAEEDPAARGRWYEAAASNCRFALSVQDADGGFGEAYALADGRVLDRKGEAGLHWITALIECWRFSGQVGYLEGAVRAGSFYRRAVESGLLTGAPEGMHLLPTSEDPMNAAMAFWHLYDATGDEEWLSVATRAADLLMTFRLQYNTRFEPESVLGAYDYGTSGMDISSPNNVHLHNFGLMAAPELTAIAVTTGDDYLLLQTRANLLACLQMIARSDGDFGAREGMMSERWFQAPDRDEKGSTLPLSHAWSLGLVVLTAEWLHDHGALLRVHERVVALDAIEPRVEGSAIVLHNPWECEIDLRLHPSVTGSQAEEIRIPGGGSATARVVARPEAAS